MTTMTMTTGSNTEQSALFDKDHFNPPSGKFCCITFDPAGGPPSVTVEDEDKMPELIEGPISKPTTSKTRTPPKKPKVVDLQSGSESDVEIITTPSKKARSNKGSPKQEQNGSPRADPNDVSDSFILTAVSPDHVDEPKSSIKIAFATGSPPKAIPTSPKSQEKVKTSPKTTSRKVSNENKNDTPSKESTSTEDTIILTSAPAEKTTYKAPFPIPHSTTFKIPALDTRSSLMYSTMDLIVRYDNHFHRTEYSNKLLRTAKESAEKQIEDLKFKIDRFGEEEKMYKDDLVVAGEKFWAVKEKLRESEGVVERVQKDFALMEECNSSYIDLEERLKSAIDRCEEQRGEIVRLERKMDALEKIEGGARFYMTPEKKDDGARHYPSPESETEIIMEGTAHRKVCKIEDCETQIDELKDELVRANERCEEQLKKIDALHKGINLWSREEQSRKDREVDDGDDEAQEKILNDFLKLREVKDLQKHIESLEEDLKEKCRLVEITGTERNEEAERREEKLHSRIQQLEDELNAMNCIEGTDGGTEGDEEISTKEQGLKGKIAQLNFELEAGKAHNRDIYEEMRHYRDQVIALNNDTTDKNHDIAEHVAHIQDLQEELENREDALKEATKSRAELGKLADKLQLQIEQMRARSHSPSTKRYLGLVHNEKDLEKSVANLRAEEMDIERSVANLRAEKEALEHEKLAASPSDKRKNSVLEAQIVKSNAQIARSNAQFEKSEGLNRLLEAQLEQVKKITAKELVESVGISEKSDRFDAHAHRFHYDRPHLDIAV